MLNETKYRFLVVRKLIFLVLVLMGSFTFAQDWERVNTPSLGSAHKLTVTKDGNILAYLKGYGFYLTEDNAENWYRISDRITDHNDDMSSFVGALTVAPNGNLYYGESCVFQSTDGGHPWEEIRGV